ncbi:hypothetical protein LIA77_06694 [Sarocladium implicatum]|nr:hypothetical protein LIA77_06694 [Sarocladium implicatum]
MKYAIAALGLATAAYAQGVTEEIKPKSSAPEGFSSSYDGKFEISVASFAKRDLEKRECSGEGALVLTLKDGVLLDSKGRTGYIADNYQFQFDKPAQTGAIYTAGFSAGGNGSLALGGSAVWYQCLSGSFYNLYDRHWAKQCEPVLLQIYSCNGGSGGGGSGGGGAGGVYTTTIIDQIGDGQPQAKPTVVTQIGDGQIQAPNGVVTQIDDGQVQGPSKVPAVTQIGDGQIQAPSDKPAPPAVTQIGDGQVQAPSEKPPPAVTQIGDGQIQAPSDKPAPPAVTQIGDGQIQAPSEKPPVVTQIGDGQVQAPSAEPKPPVVTQIGDGQIQAPSDKPPVVTQIGDGQIQAPSGEPKPPVVTQIDDGQVQAPTSVVAPPPVEETTPAAVPDSSGSKALPGTVALAVAMMGLVAYL